MAITHPTAAITRLESQAKRVSEIVRVLMKYRLAGWLRPIPVPLIHEHLLETEDGSIADLTYEVRIRMALTELGTTYIKVGQMLSTRADLVGPELATELSKLQSHTPPDPPKIVRALLEQELGKPTEEVFASFDPKPFASASVAQVHKAELHIGEAVAVKIQKSGIQEKIEADLSILASLAELAEKHLPEAKTYDPVRMVDEFRRSLLAELDFTRERRNIETFTQNFAEDDSVRFPCAWPKYSTKRVLTMNFLDGIVGSDTLALQESCEDLSQFAERGATVFLDMIFRDSFYHADPHPGNLLLMPGGVVGIIDCGMVGRLDEGLHDDFESLMLAISQGDAEVLTDTLWQMSAAQPAFGRDRLLADVSELLANTTQRSVSEMDFSVMMTELTAIIRKYKITIRPGLAGLMRTLALLEGTAELLNPQFSFAEVMRPYYEKIMVQRFSPQRWIRRFTRSYREWDQLLQTLPRDVNQTLRQIQAGKFNVHLEHRHLDSVVNRLVLGIIVASLILGSSLLWSMKAPPLFHQVSVLGILGFSMAIVLGWVLFRGVEKSGKVTSKD